MKLNVFLMLIMSLTYVFSEMIEIKSEKSAYLKCGDGKLQ